MLRRIAALTILAAVVSCKIGVGGSTGPPNGNVARVVVNPVSAMIGGGESIQLTATAFDAGGNVLTGVAISWGTSDGAVAMVAASGANSATVTGGADGTATISATSEGKSGSTAVTTSRVAFVSVSVGVGFACGLTAGGTAYCWGDNSYGELGTGAADTLPHPTPAAVTGGHTFTALRAGGAAHTCGLVAGGTMYCWGDNSFGQLGIGAVDVVPHPSPVAVTGGHAFTTFVDNGPYTCAIDGSGAAWCWGDGTYGELGSASTVSGAPIAVGGGLTFAGIDGGNFHVCAATSTGAAYCWGRNNAGQLGIGSADTLKHTAPAAVLGGIAFNGGSGGANYTCGLSGTTGYCWGGNFAGRLGTGVPGRDTVPTQIAGSISWSTISASNQTCGVSTANVGYCWGDNSVGELGIGSADTIAHATPVPVSGGLSFTSISVNRILASCGLTTGGRVYCWGDNSRGELGDGTTVERDAPVRVLAQQ